MEIFKNIAHHVIVLYQSEAVIFTEIKQASNHLGWKLIHPSWSPLGKYFFHYITYRVPTHFMHVVYRSDFTPLLPH